MSQCISVFSELSAGVGTGAKNIDAAAPGAKHRRSTQNRYVVKMYYMRQLLVLNHTECGFLNSRNLLAQLIGERFPMAWAVEPREGTRKGRVVPTPCQPRIVVK